MLLLEAFLCLFWYYLLIIFIYVYEGQFECIGENKEKDKTFFVPIKKKIIKIDKDGKETVETIFTKWNSLMVQDLWQVHY